MRSKFPGHFSETQETIDELWQSATFVFDANVLLNLYRYSDKTRKEFVRIISELKDRLWLPEQSAFEYFSNRLGVISEQEQAYRNTAAELSKIEKTFSGSNRHPFISDGNHSELTAVLKKISKELEKSLSSQETRITKDDIKSSLADIFDGRVGNPYSEDDYKDIFDKGEKRYKESIPPGYKDKAKVKDPKTHADWRRIYGDLIVWLQTISEAKNSNIDVIFVTDDSKEDWWQVQSGKTIAPRPELISEFCNETGQSILIYSPDRFVQLAKENLGSAVSEETLKEVKADHEKQVSKAAKVKFSDYLDTAADQIYERRRASAALHREQFESRAKISELVNQRNHLREKVDFIKQSIEVHRLLGDDEKERQALKELKSTEEVLHECNIVLRETSRSYQESKKWMD
ncbi:PIN-like domain-containing protein [Ruegeria lacuscaerulensis]|uniref:PIN-like domain-containing protein n=1 Tax=Ruegeria lacuscaerulensis TaxID=55218 RepID=UPI001481B305|nr:PIN-like domain-containing protein [Ruegeria lacuscaerulensis]